MGCMRRFLTTHGLPLTALGVAALVSSACTGCSGSGIGGDKAAPDPYKIGALPTADVVAKAKATGHWVKVGSTQVRFTGLVTPGASAELAGLLTPATTTAVATVTGGDLAEGLAVAQILHDHKLALDVAGPCVGPCADYWFPAAASHTALSGSWLGYVPDLSETPGATAEARSAEAKLYADSGLDSARFHTALDLELRGAPGTDTPPSAGYWMPDKADLVGIGFPAASLASMWLPPNLASANAQAHAWGDVVAYRNTLVGLPLVPTTQTVAPVPAAPTASGASVGSVAESTPSVAPSSGVTAPAAPATSAGR